MSNRYRLIKEYPGSPKLDTIINDSKTTLGISYYENCKAFIGNFPEFWELIVEYPIGTKVHNSQTNTIYTKKEDGWYKPSEKTGYSDEMIIKSHYINIIEDKVVEKDYEILELSLQRSIKHQIVSALENSEDYTISLLSCNGNKIHSVKRLSDGEIFTIGDKVNMFNGIAIITSFRILPNNEFVIDFDNKCSGIGIKNITKAKTPLFTTEDGVDIFEGDTYYKVVNESFQLLIMERASKGESLRSKVFSTKEKAEEYILLNKPCLSLKDVASIYPGINKSHPDKPSSQSERLKNLVKSKIQQSV